MRVGLTSMISCSGFFAVLLTLTTRGFLSATGVFFAFVFFVVLVEFFPAAAGDFFAMVFVTFVVFVAFEFFVTFADVLDFFGAKLFARATVFFVVEAEPFPPVRGEGLDALLLDDAEGFRGLFNLDVSDLEVDFPLFFLAMMRLSNGTVRHSSGAERSGGTRVRRWQRTDFLYS